MSLHYISEPAGTLMTGWKLVPKREPHAADIHVEEALPEARPAEASKVTPASKWESERELSEVR